MEENILLLTAIIFAVSWLVKIILYGIFDRYETDFGRIGRLFTGTFMMYKKEELEDEANPKVKTIMRINNVCGYIMLAVILSVSLGILIMVFF
ncbi:MAG: hypothetical protein FWF72_04655 [Paludibacter sp.]|nr:hypothetical protein [Paludibacter sp.]